MSSNRISRLSRTSEEVEGGRVSSEAGVLTDDSGSLPDMAIPRFAVECAASGEPMATLKTGAAERLSAA
jgi:hypothetical protein